jgi:hypothetical protein
MQGSDEGWRLLLGPAVQRGLCFFHANPDKLSELGRQGGTCGSSPSSNRVYCIVICPIPANLAEVCVPLRIPATRRM